MFVCAKNANQSLEQEPCYTTLIASFTTDLKQADITHNYFLAHKFKNSTSYKIIIHT